MWSLPTLINAAPRSNSKHREITRTFLFVCFPPSLVAIEYSRKLHSLSQNTDILTTDRRRKKPLGLPTSKPGASASSRVSAACLEWMDGWKRLKTDRKRRAGRNHTPRELRCALTKLCVCWKKVKEFALLKVYFVFAYLACRSIPLDLDSSFLDFFLLRTSFYYFFIFY